MLPLSINNRKRNFLKFSVLLPIAIVSKHITSKFSYQIFTDDDIVIINGWVLLKSDLKQEH